MIFLYGTLRHLPLLEIVLGQAPVVRPATAPDRASVWAAGQSFPLLVPRKGAVAEGLVIEAEGDDQSRLDFYELGFGYTLQAVPVEVEGQPVDALAYVPDPGLWEEGAPFDPADWADRHAALIVPAAQRFLSLWPERRPAEAARMYPQILMREQSRQRAVSGATPRGIREGRGAATVEDLRRPYINYFAVAEADLRFPRFDGTQSEAVTRAAFEMADAVTVLPYDPGRDRVLVVEQFRFGPWLRGDPLPWVLEPIAGRIDGGETAEQAARREAQEESGLTVADLIRVGRYYPSPGAVTEYLISYLAVCDLPDSLAAVGGLDVEAEDIRSHLVPFARLMEMVDEGLIENAPLLISALDLARRRDGLRG